MFQIGNARGIIKYILVCALTLSSECQAAVNKDDNIHYFTTRRPHVEQFTVPTYAPQFSDSSTDEEDRTIFFVVISLSAVFIGLLSYLCHKSKDSSTSGSSRVTGGYRTPGAVVHPPPRHLTLSSTTPTAPPVLGRSTSNPRPEMMVSFVNTGYQSDSAVDGARAGDVPPDYAAVTIGDLTTPHKSKFPSVILKKETPPPKYTDGHPFSP